MSFPLTNDYRSSRRRMCRVDLSGSVTALMGTSSSGQSHETLVSTVVAEILEREPDSIRVIKADSLNALPSNSPVGSRMAIMLGGAAAGAAKKIRHKLRLIAAHNLKVTETDLGYRDGGFYALHALLAPRHGAWVAREICLGGAHGRRAPQQRRSRADVPMPLF